MHKVLSQLESERVLCRQGNKFLISDSYIDEVRDLSERLHSAYRNGPLNVLEKFEKTGFAETKADTHADMSKFVLDYLDANLREGDVLICAWPNMCHSTCYGKEEYRKIRRIGSVARVYFLSAGNSILDAFFGKMWNAAGGAVKLGVPFSPVFKTFVLHDVIIDVHQPPHFRDWNLWLKNAGFGAIKSIASLDFSKLYESMNSEKGEFIIKMHRNASLAESLRKEALAHFK